MSWPQWASGSTCTSNDILQGGNVALCAHTYIIHPKQQSSGAERQGTSHRAASIYLEHSLWTQERYYAVYVTRVTDACFCQV